MKRRLCEWCGDVAAKHYTKCVKCRDLPAYKVDQVKMYIRHIKRKQLALEKELQEYIRSLYE